MIINCIACGHTVELADSYDDYEGPVRCWVCGTLLEIKAQDGSLRRMGLFKPPTVTVRNALQESTTATAES